MAEENAQASSPNGGGKGLIIALISLIVVLLIALGVGAYFLFSSSNEPQNGQNESQQQAIVEPKEVIVGQEYKSNINEIVLNITNSKGKLQLMKLSLSMTSFNDGIQTITDEYTDEIKDVVISLVSARNSDELLTVGGKELLREELLNELNKTITSASSRTKKPIENPINKVLFTEFVFK
ncbi:MAG: flagellar basal body-associated FliL family protein [Arcobacteraceae bacterium]